MKWSMSGVAVLVAAVCSVVASAQSGGTMPKADTMDTMQKMDASYTGCIEAGSGAGTFTLTHLEAADHMSKETMKTDSMKKADSMTKDTMAMKKDTMASDSMSHDSMAPTALTLAGSQADFRKHVGHKVTVTGSHAHENMDAMKKDTMDKSAPTFTVKSLKMVATSCS